MSKTCRIDAPLFIAPDGSVEIYFTTGQAPLSSQPQGASVGFPSVAALQLQIAELIDKFDDRTLALLNLVNHAKLVGGDSDLSMARKSVGQGGLFPGKAITVDLTFGIPKAIDFK